MCRNPGKEQFCRSGDLESKISRLAQCREIHSCHVRSTIWPMTRCVTTTPPTSLRPGAPVSDRGRNSNRLTSIKPEIFFMPGLNVAAGLRDQKTLVVQRKPLAARERGSASPDQAGASHRLASGRWQHQKKLCGSGAWSVGSQFGCVFCSNTTIACNSNCPYSRFCILDRRCS